MLADGTEASASNDSSRGFTNGSVQNNGTQRVSRGGVANGSYKTSALNGLARTAPPQSGGAYMGHDRKELTRILLQALHGMGFHHTAESLGRESGHYLESPVVDAFRTAVLQGQWADAETMLLEATAPGQNQSNDNVLVLAPDTSLNLMRFWLRQQKYLELLENKDSGKALTVLRTELTPLDLHNTQKLHFLSSLLMCQTTKELFDTADWDGSKGTSRKTLLANLTKCISPAVMLPENRLADLLHQAKQTQIRNCIYHTEPSPPSLYSDHVCDEAYFPTETVLQLGDVNGETWKIEFSPSGKFLAASGKNGQVIIWNVPTFMVHITLGHEDRVGSFAWSPDETLIVTCCFDRYMRLWSVDNGVLLAKSEEFSEPCSGAFWAPDGETFVVSSLDKWRSLQTYNATGTMLVNWFKRHRVQELAGSQDGKWIIAASDKQNIHVYDSTTRELEFKMDIGCRPLSVSISADSKHLLINKQNGDLILVDMARREQVRKFVGHTAGEYLIRASFGGADENFVMCGSEDGNVLIWHRHNAMLVARLPGHYPRSNNVAWNRRDACMVASCGDDGLVKIWVNHARNGPLKQLHAKAAQALSGWTDRVNHD